MTTTTVSPMGGVELGGSAPLTVVHGGGQVDGDIVVEWDLDNDGDFDESVEDITSFVMALETRAGRDFASNITGKAQPGQLKMTLLNNDDRFSFFNADSPLMTDPFSLRTGRKIRVRTSESTPNDPVLLVRDRFNRGDGALGITETGQTWESPTTGDFTVVGQQAQASDDFGQHIINVVPCGEADHYAQATIHQLTDDRDVGLVVRFTDTSNFVYLHMNGVEDAATGLQLREVDGGVDSLLASTSFTPWEGMTIGLGVVGSTVTAYVAGVPVLTDTLADNPSATKVGLYANYLQFSGPAPEIDDFYCWDHVASEVDGILWTGTIKAVEPDVALGPYKTVSVDAEGVLAQLATDIASPRVPYSGQPTGYLVGDVLARAGALHPPVPLDEGAVTTGPVGIPDGNALNMARLFEETERGFLHETPEGYIDFDDITARVGATPVAEFSDTPGTGQFGFSRIAPLDHSSQIINRVLAGVAPETPTLVSITDDFGSGDVSVTLPTTADNDLLVVFIASSVDNSRDWFAPIWWTEHRNLKDATGMRVYSHFCDGTESGDTIQFYESGAAAGLWAAQVWRIQDWYEASQGVVMGTVTRGGDPESIVHGWGREPTLFIICRIGIGSVLGMEFTSDFNPPEGYIRPTNDGFLTSTGTPATDVGIVNAYKIACTEAEDAADFPGLEDAIIDESVLFAIRGFNGPHQLVGTIANPNQFEASPGRIIEANDTASQDEHGGISTYVNQAGLFATEADAQAYCDAILATYADDRPIVSLTFPATISAAYRAQAFRRRVGDMIYLTASGETGLGVEGEFFVENIGHRWTDAGKRWEVTWELSPA